MVLRFVRKIVNMFAAAVSRRLVERKYGYSDV